MPVNTVRPLGGKGVQDWGGLERPLLRGFNAGRGFWMYLNANVLGSQAGPTGTAVGRGRGSGPGRPTETRSVASGSRASPSSGSQPCWPTQAQPDALPVQCHCVEGGSVGGEGSLGVSPDPGGPFVQSRQRGHWAGPLPRGWTAASWSLSVEGVDKQLLARGRRQQLLCFLW